MSFRNNFYFVKLQKKNKSSTKVQKTIQKLHVITKKKYSLITHRLSSLPYDGDHLRQHILVLVLLRLWFVIMYPTDVSHATAGFNAVFTPHVLLSHVILTTEPHRLVREFPIESIVVIVEHYFRVLYPNVEIYQP